MTSDWPTVTIGELADPRPGSLAVGPFGSRMKAELYVASGVRVIRGNNLSGDREPEGEYVFVAEKTADSMPSCCLKPGDLVFPHRGNIGEVGITPNDGHRYMLSTSLMKLSPDLEKVDADFLLYFFKSEAGRASLLMNASQVGTPGIATPLKSLRGIRLSLPPLSVQREMVSVLKALDDKRMMGRRINRVLEATAQTIFKSWFMDFDPVRAKLDGRIPEGMDESTAALFPAEFCETDQGMIPRGWKSGVLGDICLNHRDGAKPENISDETPYVGLEHMPRRSISLNDWGTAGGLESGKFRFQTGDILFGKLRPYFHKVGFAPVDGVCSTDILVVRPTIECWQGLALAHLSSSALIDYATQLSNGAKMPRTNWTDIANYAIAIPDKSVASLFNDIVSGFMQEIRANIATNLALRSIRDRLLPKLISGQIRLSEVQNKEMAEAL